MERVADRFDLLAEVATGGMGVVYRAFDRLTGDQVALKRLRELDPETVKRFEREAEILAGLQHPGIVRYVAHGTTGSSPYLVMEWIVGETLHGRLHREGMSIAETVLLGRRLADALAHAHRAGVVHRDIKPSNVMLRGDQLEHATLVDFGVARLAVASTSVTATGVAIGTPAYMSPEQARGMRELTAASDVYSLGCLLYECMTGERPVDGKHALAVLAKVALWEPTPASRLNPAIPPALDKLIAQMLAKPAADRPSDREVAEQLASLDVGSLDKPMARAETNAEATARSVPRHGSIVIASSTAGDQEGTIVVDDEAFARREIILRALVSTHPIRAEIVRDGSIVVIAEAPRAKEAAKLALLVARALVAAVPECTVAISSGDLMTPKPYEATVAGLAKDAIKRLFSAVSGGAPPADLIRVDAATERLLEVPIERIGGIGYVR